MWTHSTSSLAVARAPIGTEDQLVPLQEAITLHGLIPGSRLVEYRGNHSLGNDESTTALLAAAVVELVDGVPIT